MPCRVKSWIHWDFVCDRITLEQAWTLYRTSERTLVAVNQSVGPASDHELVLRGRLETQAPDLDASVFLTECDPSSFRSGDFVEVEIVGTRDYDLIARPVNGGLSTL